MADPIRITTNDLHRPEVDDYVEMQRFLRRDVGELSDRPWIIRVIYANWFYLAICSMVGALVGWACLEPFYSEADALADEVNLIGFLWFPTVTSCIGLFLGAAEGLICRNAVRAVRSGSIALGVGFVGGFLVLMPAGLIFAMMAGIAAELAPELQEGQGQLGLGLLLLFMGRAAAWAIAAIPAGIGQGIALKEKKVIINGLVGGVLGGLVGGMLFDPVDLLLTPEQGEAALSRGIGFATIGLFVGLFVGLVEGWTKTAWLLMRKGPLAGKQFILYKDATVLGSSPKADVYLFKDDAIEPRHALLVNRGGRFEIEDCSTPDGTYVNGIPIKRHVLSDGDQIVLGKTVLEFSVKEAKPA